MAKPNAMQIPLPDEAVRAKLKRRRRLLVAAATLLAIFAAGGTWYARTRTFFGDGRVDISVTETRICAKPRVPVFPKWSADLRHVFFTVERGEKTVAVFDGAEGKPDDEIWEHMNLEFLSREGGHFAYPARVGDEWIMVVDGIEGPACDEVLVGESETRDGPRENMWPSMFAFSDSGRHFAYTARRGENRHVVFDGVEGPAYDAVFKLSFALSGDGKRLAYAGRRGTEYFLNLDGIERPCERLGPSWFSPDGRSHFYAAQRGQGHLLVNGEYAGCLMSTVEYTADGKHWLCLAVPDDRMPAVEGREIWFLRDGEQVKLCARLRLKDNLRPGRPVVVRLPPPPPPRPPGTRPVSGRGASPWTMVTAAPGSTCELTSYWFSPDGKRVAFKGGGRGEFMIIDGAAEQPFQQASRFFFSPDSARYCYVARSANADWFPVVDSAVWTGGGNVRDMVFSPDSKHFAHVVKTARTLWLSALLERFPPFSRRPMAAPTVTERLMVDNARGPSHPRIQRLFFTAESRHVVYLTRHEGSLALFVDGLRKAVFPEVVGTLAMERSGDGFAFLVMREKEFVRVEVTVTDKE